MMAIDVEAAQIVALIYALPCAAIVTLKMWWRP